MGWLETGRCLGPVIALAFHLPAQATQPAGNSQRILAIGVIAHDRGPAADHHERGVDLNLEVQFAPLDLSGSVRPHLGATLNFEGDTSMAYAGLSFRLRETRQGFADLLLSVAAYDGPLHKDPVGYSGSCGGFHGTGIRPVTGQAVEVATLEQRLLRSGNLAFLPLPRGQHRRLQRPPI